MKINYVNVFLHKRRKVLQTIMRTILLLFFTSAFSLTPNSSLSQNAKIKIDSDKLVTVSEIFELVQEQVGYKFIYADELVSNAPKVNLKKGVILAKVLLEMGLAPINCTYEFTENETVIVKRRLRADLPVNKIENESLQFQISGTITDSNGQPLPGASIVEKGTSNGTQSDFDGNFTLEVAGKNAVLVVSYIGFGTKEVVVGEQTKITIPLMESAAGLDEVVVVGYGTQSRKDVTGSISSVGGDIISNIPSASVEQSLSGRMAGVQVISGSGAPGSGATIRVRGVGTLNNNEPLYVVDGIILGNVAGGGQSTVSPLSLINPSDIESIDVLKDASATAIYGARAGNGVVIITTKRGRNQKMNITYETFTSTNIIDGSKYNQMSGPEWADFYSKGEIARGRTEYQGKAFVERILAGEDIPTYDWIGELVRNGTIQSHNLSVSGGNENSNYFSSLSYFDQTGVIYGSDLERYTIRFNSDHKIGEKLKFGNSILLSRSITNRQGNVDPNDNINNYITRGLGMNVYKPIYREDGTYAGSDSYDPDSGGLLDQDNNHIIWNAKENTNLNSNNRILASVNLDYEIVDGLVFKTMGSIDYSFIKAENRNKANDIEGTMLVLPEDTRLRLRQDEDRKWFLTNTLTYNKTFNDHTVSALAGMQVENSLSTYFSATDGGFENTDYWFFNRPHLQREVLDGNGNVVLTLPVYTAEVANGQFESGVNSFFGRLFYDYKNRYLLTATVRYDGSSKFGSNKRWGTFPALSGGWRISQEDFMSDVSWISNLKLRAGYGISGSDNVSNYQYASSVGQGGEYNYSFNGGEVNGATLNRLSNPFLRWEEIKMSNIGLDIGLFNSRINIVADYYDKVTSDLFLPFAPSLELGNESNPNGNLGEVSNKGLDLSISSVNMQGAFNWTTDFVFGTVKNEILKLPSDADRFVNTYNISRVGEEVGAIYGYELDGIFQNWEEVYDHAYQDQAVIEFDENNIPIYDTAARDEETMRTSTSPGDFRYKDLNGDGFIDADNDRKVIGSSIPDFTWGLTNTFSYKGISLTAFFQGVQGVNVYNLVSTTYPTRNRLNAWNGEGSTNIEPRIAGNGNGRTSAYSVENASYARLKNLRIAYNLPQSVIENIGMNAVQLYLNGTNLFTITNYTGYDPEIGLRDAGDNETAGIDRGQYPLTRQFTFGAKISF